MLSIVTGILIIPIREIEPMPPVKKVERARRLRANEEKWSVPLVDAGWTLLPSTILEYQSELGIDPIDLNILLQIARHWWKPGDAPYPSMRKIADCIGKSVSTVQRRVSKMRAKGIISVKHRFNKYGGQTSSAYYFDGLTELALPYAKETLDDRAERKRGKGNHQKSTKKRPDLKIVKE